MNRRAILGTAAVAGTVLLVAVVAGCVAFFPSAKDPGYEFVAATTASRGGGESAERGFVMAEAKVAEIAPGAGQDRTA